MLHRLPGLRSRGPNDIVVVPIRTGVGIRLGANVGYLKFTPTATAAVHSARISLPVSGCVLSNDAKRCLGPTAVAVGVKPSAVSSKLLRCALPARRFPDTPERLSCC